jgi:hypothetical protein
VQFLWRIVVIFCALVAVPVLAARCQLARVAEWPVRVERDRALIAVDDLPQPLSPTRPSVSPSARDMLERLKVGDIDRAMTAISETTREQYRAVFTSMGTGLSAAAAGAVKNASVSETYGWLGVIREEADGTYGYTIYLVQDGDGIWRIDGM